MSAENLVTYGTSEEAARSLAGITKLPNAANVHGIAQRKVLDSVAPLEGQFVAVDGRFDLERAGRVVRLWCVTCWKHQVLDDDGVRSIEAARESHRCGPRTDEWDHDYSQGSGGSA